MAVRESVKYAVSQIASELDLGVELVILVPTSAPGPSDGVEVSQGS